MISIAINTTTGTAALSARNAIKAGGKVPVVVTFSTNPGTVTHLDLSISEDSSSAITLAYLEDWETQNETTRTGWLDANDTRLVEAVSGAVAKTMLCEVSWTVGGNRRIAPNFALTVQRPVVVGPVSGESGPAYYTAAQIQALFASLEAEDVGLGAVTNGAQVLRAEMGEPDGVATLDGNGKVPLSQLPDSVVGQIEFQTGWDADLNEPDLSSIEAEKGWYYLVTVEGTSDPDDAGRTFRAGDWIVFDGSVWHHIRNTEPLATTAIAGLVQLATSTEVSQRRATNRAVVPADLRDSNSETLTGNKTLVAGNSPVQMLDPGAADRDVTLPVIAATPTGDQVGYGHSYQIYHTGSAYTLSIKANGGSLLARADWGDHITVVATASGWRVTHAPRSGALVVSVLVDIASGSAGDDIDVYSPPTGLRADIVAARWVHESSGGTISTQGQVTLYAGSSAISTALSLSTSPTVGTVLDFSLSSGRTVISVSNPLKLRKSTIAAGTTPSHTGCLVLTLALF